MIWLLQLSYYRSLLEIGTEKKMMAFKTYQCAKIIPHFRDEGVQADSPGVGIQGIPVLIDLVVKYADGAPESRVSAVSVHSLLIRFICFGIFLLRHIAPAKEVPTLRIAVVCLLYYVSTAQAG